MPHPWLGKLGPMHLLAETRTGNANSHLSQCEVNHTLKWHFLGSNRNPSSAKFHLKYSPRWKFPTKSTGEDSGPYRTKVQKENVAQEKFPVVKSELDWQKELSPTNIMFYGRKARNTPKYNKFYPKPGEGYFGVGLAKTFALYSIKFDSGCGCTYFLFPSPTPNHPRIFY